MPEYRVDLQDLKFVLRDQVRLGQVLETERYQGFTWEDIEMVLTESERMAREVIRPLQADSDRLGSKLVEGRVKVPLSFHKAYKAYCEAGWNAVDGTAELGGQGLPHAISAAVTDITLGACPSFYFFPALAHAASFVIESVGSPEQVATYCRKMYTGQWGGTMCLTEPNAGSAVGDLRTSAVKDAEGGFYRIKGNKLFISAGDHDITENIIHLVLARTPDAPPGIKGVSLFIVPRVRPDGTFNDVHVTALEEKMGLHGKPTCALAFGDEGDCRGWIIGNEGEGIQHMFLMMNEARIAVGLQASSMANWAYQLSLEYAKERVQGVDVAAMKDPTAPRVPIIRHPDVRRMLMTMKAFSEGIRSLLMVTASFADRMETAPTEREREKYRNLLEILTPICKAYGSYRGFDVADLAIMVHGGYGYIREYQVEGILRDIKIAAIYEGTNGIQALDLLGRKVAQKGGMAFMFFIQWVNDLVAAHKNHPVVGPLAARLESAKNTLAAVTMELGQKSASGDLYYATLQASPYLELFGDVVLGRLLVEQAVIAADRRGSAPDADAAFYEGKIRTAEFYIHQHLPRVEALASAIRSGDRSALEMPF